jgi:eukaryotic-like serine/threonine-protein kinase
LPPARGSAHTKSLVWIGAGGMGEVYKAKDTRLKRDVAIKALPENVASDPERLARFQREAELLASLNHSHIAHIQGLEEAGRVPALVMEFVEGEDLAQKIARGLLWYSRREISQSNAAEIAGTSRAEFIDELAHRRIPSCR